MDTIFSHSGLRDHGFREGLSCNVPNKHFRITSYQGQNREWSVDRQDEIILWLLAALQPYIRSCPTMRGGGGAKNVSALYA